jgi:hypothetical protein
MFCFNNVGRQIVGKSCEIVLRGVSEHSPIPPDLVQIISLKFTFRVTFDDQSFFQQNNHPNVLRINSIVTAHGRQRSLPLQAQNHEQQGPSTPPVTLGLKLFEDSPSAALEKLSTMTPTAVRYVFNQKIIQYIHITLLFRTEIMCQSTFAGREEASISNK